jgi:hypothetical protein
LADHEGRTGAPRMIQDLVEERLFARRRELFNDLERMFFDTSAPCFHGEAAQGSAVLAAPHEQLSRGDDTVVGNRGFRRFLKVDVDDHFALDEATVAEDARLDGF